MSFSTIALLTTLAGPCRPAPGLSAAALVTRADSAVGLSAASGRVLLWSGRSAVLQDYQSDRTYPPFFSAFQDEDGAYDLTTGALRLGGRASYLSYGTRPTPELLSTGTAAWVVRDTLVVPTPGVLATTSARRALLALPVLRDWAGDPAVRVEGICEYRDYPRVVLTRRVAGRTERLFLDPKTGVPVKLDRSESHYLWGQVHVEYVWSNWLAKDGLLIPGSAFRLVDGSVETSLIVTGFDLAPGDSAARLRLPDPALVQTAALPAFLTPTMPDTVRVGPTTVLLRNRGYTELVTLRHDTVFMFEATQGEERARGDSTWIARLFPGPHPIVVIVTDLAWPHVAGVRFWVARGATIVSHRASEAFLRQVVGRRWPEAPDLLETLRRRGRAPQFRFRPVDRGTTFAAGEVALAPIDGITSEVALIGWLPADRFLWGSDYVQDLSAPNEYAAEVRAAAHRAGFAPERLAAEHLPLSAWSTIEGLYPSP